MALVGLKGVGSPFEGVGIVRRHKAEEDVEEEERQQPKGELARKDRNHLLVCDRKKRTQIIEK